MILQLFYNTGLSKNTMNYISFWKHSTALGIWILTAYTLLYMPNISTDDAFLSNILVSTCAFRNAVDILFVDSTTIIHHIMVLLYSYMYFYCDFETVKMFMKPVFYTELSSIFLLIKDGLRYIKPKIPATYLPIFDKIEKVNLIVFASTFYYFRIYYYGKTALFSCYQIPLGYLDNIVCNITDVTFYGLNVFWGIYIFKKGCSIYSSKK
jgi:hypothetical protein